MIFFAFLLLAPLLEIALFIAVAGEIGPLATIGLYLLSAMAGLFLIKYQWVNALQAGYKAHRTRHLPLGEMFDSLCWGVAGILLLLPGLLSDLLAFTLIIPMLRELWRQFLIKRLNIPEMTATENYVIDAEFARVDDDNERIESRDR